MEAGKLKKGNHQQSVRERGRGIYKEEAYELQKEGKALALWPEFLVEDRDIPSIGGTKKEKPHGGGHADREG